VRPSHSLQGVFDGRVNEAGVSTASPRQECSTLLLNGTGLRWLFATVLLHLPSKPPQEQST